jgi:GDP-L-fucose synthase
LVGSAVWRALAQRGVDLVGWTSQELDLRDRDATFDAVTSTRPDVIVMAAARVGGIMANSTHPVQFLNENLRVQTNLFEAAHENDVERVLFLGSNCIYPRDAAQPIAESSLMTGPLERTNRAYAIAKIAGIEAVWAYRQQYGRRWISAMPCNLYGPGDNFSLTSSHVLPALIRKLSDGADRVDLWGTGTPRREFLHSDDAASAMIHLLEHYDGDAPVNVGYGEDVSIAELAAIVADVVGFEGEIVWDTSKPDGTPRKLLDISTLRSLGWAPRIGLRAGIGMTYEWFTANPVAD